MSRVLGSLWAEVDEARLVRMEGESIPCEPLAEDRQNAFGVDDVVERHQRVVGKPDKGALPSQTRFHLSLERLLAPRAGRMRGTTRLHPLAGSPRWCGAGDRLPRLLLSAIYRSSFG